MNKKVWIGVAIIVPIILFSTISIILSQSNQTIVVDVVQPQMGMINDEIMVPGEMDLAVIDHVMLQANEAYTVLVEEGDLVEEGTPLVEYDGADLEFQKEQLAFQIEGGYLRINQLNKQEEHLEEQQQTLEEDIGKEEARDHFRAEREQLQYEKRLANLDLRQLLAQKEQLEKREEDLVERSTIAGTVIVIKEDQDGVITIADPTSFIVKGFLSEYDSLEIMVGQKVDVVSDAIIDHSWKGEVKSINYFPSETEVAGSGINYPFTVRLNDGDLSVLRPGYQVILNIVTQERQALTIPYSSVIQENEEPYVFVIIDGVAIQREVELGVATDGRFEIRSGLQQSERIVTDIPSGLRNGTDVIIND
jgi:HlyD family secretion protein